MRKLLVSAAIATALLGPAVLAASDARADAPPAGARRHAAAHPPAMARHHHHRRFRPAYGHRMHRFHGGGFAIGPSYGGLPAFYPGESAAADGLEGAPTMMMLYREAYIGRGLIYNTPPQAGAGRGAALSVLY